MPAQLVWFYSLLSFLLLPFSVFNLLVLKTPFFEGVKSFVITSGSMEPVIPQGSIVYTIKERIYEKGDMVTFINGDQAIAHRIVDSIKLSGQTYFSTKGDANTFHDYDLVTPSQIDGRIATVVPVLGKVILFYRTPTGFLLGTLVPLFLLFPVARMHFLHVVKLYRTS